MALSIVGGGCETRRERGVSPTDAACRFLEETFEREFIDAQGQVGIQMTGTFRDLADEQRFVWIRAFPDMTQRAAGLEAFYGGPVWRRHRDAANATMVDSDNVLLLRPAWRGSGFQNAGVGSPAQAPGHVRAGIVPFRDPVDETGLRYFSEVLEPAIEASGARMLACLISEHAANTFPALPVRERENVLVWFAGSSGVGTEARPEGSFSMLSEGLSSWPRTAGPTEIRVLEPTPRSPLNGSSDTGYRPAPHAPSPA